MRRVCRATLVAGLLATAAAGSARAQPPGVPAAPPAPALPGPAAAATAVPAPGAAGERVGLVKRICIGLDECRRKLCKTPAGKLLNGMTAPLTGFTGGVIPPFCPVMPSPADLQKPGVAGAAAAAQKEALEAKERRDAVRFLGTLDCRYFPDASVKLAAALRMDSSECVRFEAALVLGRGCCCTEVTVRALMASVSGTDMDGAPAERSARVRCAAAIALEKCLSCFTLPPDEDAPVNGGGDIKDKDRPKDVGKQSAGDKDAKDDARAAAADAGYKLPPGQKLPAKATVEKAWKILNEFNAMLAAYEPVLAAQPPGVARDRRSVFHLMKDSAGGAEAGGVTPAAAPVPVATPAPAVAAAPKAMPMTVSTPAPPKADKPTAAEPPAAPKLLPVTTPKPATVPAPMPPAAAVNPMHQPVNRVARQVVQGATPADRHAAIRELVKFDWKQHPMVASALLAGAKADAVDVVRVDCVRHLAAYKVAHPQVLAELGALTNDSDPWVRQEAAAALAQLKGQ